MAGIAVALALVTACAGASEQLHTDAESAASVAAQAQLLADQAAAGHLTAPYVSTQQVEIASDAATAAAALDQDQGHDADRRALADDLRRVASAVRRLDRAELQRLAQDAQQRAQRL